MTPVFQLQNHLATGNQATDEDAASCKTFRCNGTRSSGLHQYRQRIRDSSTPSPFLHPSVSETAAIASARARDSACAGVQALAAKHEKDSAKISLETFPWRLKAVHQRRPDQHRKGFSQPNQVSIATACITSLRCHVSSTMTSPLTKKS